jgi:hypothetical protein
VQVYEIWCKLRLILHVEKLICRAFHVQIQCWLLISPQFFISKGIRRRKFAK